MVPIDFLGCRSGRRYATPVNYDQGRRLVLPQFVPTLKMPAASLVGRRRQSSPQEY